MCTQKPPHDYSQQLYERYKDSCDKYIIDKARTTRLQRNFPAPSLICCVHSALFRKRRRQPFFPARVATSSTLALRSHASTGRPIRLCLLCLTSRSREGRRCSRSS